MTDPELNEAFAVYVEGEHVSGGSIVEVEAYGLDRFLTRRVIPDYVKELGSEVVLDRLETKLMGTYT